MKNNENFFLKIAKIVSENATCPRASVGCVVVREDKIISTGYNGAASGMPHCGCILDFDKHCINAVHAEVNAIVNAALHGVSTKNATLYSTHSPCDRCFPVLVNAGITEVIYLEEYENCLLKLKHKNKIRMRKHVYND